MKTQAQALEIIQNLTFGVEIECRFPKELAREYGILVTRANWSHMIDMNHLSDLEGNSLRDWQAGYDCTIARREGYHAIEFTSRVLKGEQGLQSVVRFFQWLEAKGGQVDSSCGLHIHIGVKGFTEGDNVDQAIETMLKTMKFANSIKTTIFAQTGSARRYLNDRWARVAGDKNHAEQRAQDNRVPCFGGRYFFLNTQRVQQNGIGSNSATIEFRAFAGTCNYAKVLNHLMTCFACVHAGMTIKRSTWNARNYKTADLGYEAFNSFTKAVSVEAWFKAFPTFQAEKRKMFKIGRKMAKKFATNIRRAVTRSNGSLDLNRFA